jgi:hypothetical protein
MDRVFIFGVLVAASVMGVFLIHWMKLPSSRSWFYRLLTGLLILLLVVGVTALCGIGLAWLGGGR